MGVRVCVCVQGLMWQPAQDTLSEVSLTANSMLTSWEGSLCSIYSAWSHALNRVHSGYCFRKSPLTFVLIFCDLPAQMTPASS